MRKITVISWILALVGFAGAGAPVKDLPVTSIIHDGYTAIDASGLPVTINYKIQSDATISSAYSACPAGQVACAKYQNGVNSVESVLQGVSLNGISGDWVLDNRNTPRQIKITLNDPDPNYSVSGAPNPAPIPTFTHARFIVKCSSTGFLVSLRNLKPADGPKSCPLLVRFDGTSSYDWRLDFDPTESIAPEINGITVQCNAVNSSGNCADWSIDPITQPDGSRKSRARLVKLGTVHSVPAYTNEGDYYISFHIHVTNP